MKKYLIATLLLLGSYAYTTGQALTYRPVNPAFGGNSFNYQWMIGSAQAQDTFKDPTARTTQRRVSAQTSNSTLDNFAKSLNQQLLSRITRQILSNQFGEEGLQEGDFKYGDFQVSIRNGFEGIQVRILDGNGGETTVTVPYY
jgi:curli production assembly/transport component CsgF